jgi:hypothetical protein
VNSQIQEERPENWRKEGAETNEENQWSLVSWKQKENST